MFEKLEKRVVVKYRVEVKSDLHIGAGGTTAPNSVDLPVIRDAEGYPMIPGSSLKGVLRSEMQKLLNTQFDDEEVKCDESGKEKVLKKADIHVAELFGGNIVVEENGVKKVKSVAGSIRVRDAKASTKKTRIRDGVEIDLSSRKAKEGRKFEIEVVPKGTTFDGEIYIENPRLGDKEYEKVGALLSTIEFFNATTRGLGGGTSRGFGEVEIQILKISEYTPEDYLEGNTQGKPLDEKKKNEAKQQWKEYVLSIRGGN